MCLTVNSTLECEGSIAQVPCGMEVLTVDVLIEEISR
jgi:hypothetical protein